MSFLQRAKEAASSAAEQARVAAEQARQKAQDPATHEALRVGVLQAGEGARIAGSAARRGMSNMIDKIDPGMLADLVIKATALQEKTNGSLRTKGSPYRIAEVTITATFPPQIGFAISRVGDIEERLTGNEVDSAELVQEVLAEEAVSGQAMVADGDLPAADEGASPVAQAEEMGLPAHVEAEDILP